MESIFGVFPSLTILNEIEAYSSMRPDLLTKTGFSQNA